MRLHASGKRDATRTYESDSDRKVLLLLIIMMHYTKKSITSAVCIDLHSALIETSSREILNNELCFTYHVSVYLYSVR